IRARKVNINDAHVKILNGEAQLINIHIAPYDQGNSFNHDPTRTRKLLLHSKETDKLLGATQRQGYTIVTLKMNLKNEYTKSLIGLGRGKKQYYKRHDLKQKQMKRDIDRAMKDVQR